MKAKTLQLVTKFKSQSIFDKTNLPSYYDYVRLKGKDAPQELPFTKREIEVIRLIVQGMTSYEISELLFISEHTVKQHRKNILKKSNLSLPQLVSEAIKRGWL